MPEAKPFAIPEQEFAEEYVRPSSGPGGQHQNKTENGVRVYWNIAETAVLTEAPVSASAEAEAKPGA